jgi:hypothetical protein
VRRVGSEVGDGSGSGGGGVRGTGGDNDTGNKGTGRGGGGSSRMVTAGLSEAPLHSLVGPGRLWARLVVVHCGLRFSRLVVGLGAVVGVGLVGAL